MVFGLSNTHGQAICYGKDKNNKKLHKMSKIQNLSEPWDGVHNGNEVEAFLKEQLQNAVHVSSEEEVEDLHVGGINLRIVSKEAFEHLESFEENVLYAVVK